MCVCVNIYVYICIYIYISSLVVVRCVLPLFSCMFSEFPSLRLSYPRQLSVSPYLLSSPTVRLEFSPRSLFLSLIRSSLPFCSLTSSRLFQAYVSLERSYPREPMSFAEWVLFAWMSLLVIEEMRQTCFIGGVKFSFLAAGRSLKAYWGDLWNKLDISIFVMYFIAAGLRLSYTESAVVCTILQTARRGSQDSCQLLQDRKIRS